jgi:TIR domain
MFDLFISYASDDRPWAERLYTDLRRSFPTIQIFWDRTSIPPGANWPAVLKKDAETAKHLVTIWSEKAKASDQVGPEIQAFDQNVATNPLQDGAKRTLFYIPLEGQYGPLEVTEGFTELRRDQTYEPTAIDRGTSKLDKAPHRDEWRRIIRIIGDTVLAAEPTQPINLALLVMNQSNCNFIDPFLDVKVGPGPTLREFLNAAGLTLAQVKSRYGGNAFEWMPFGGTQTVIELMQELRVMVNQGLNAEHRFHWVPCDLAAEVTDDIAFRQRLDRLAERPSAVIVDGFSLFHPLIKGLFGYLGDYAKKEYSMIVSLAPNAAPTADRLYQGLRANGAPVLDGYFLPQIPSTTTFARCRINVEHISELERLIRGSLGIYHLRRRKADDKSLVSLGA